MSSTGLQASVRPQHYCQKCNKPFKDDNSLARHMRTSLAHVAPTLFCPVAGCANTGFTEEYVRTRHMRRVHGIYNSGQSGTTTRASTSTTVPPNVTASTSTAGPSTDAPTASGPDQGYLNFDEEDSEHTDAKKAEDAEPAAEPPFQGYLHFDPDSDDSGVEGPEGRSDMEEDGLEGLDDEAGDTAAEALALEDISMEDDEDIITMDSSDSDSDSGSDSDDEYQPGPISPRQHQGHAHNHIAAINDPFPPGDPGQIRPQAPHLQHGQPPINPASGPHPLARHYAATNPYLEIARLQRLVQEKDRLIELKDDMIVRLNEELEVQKRKVADLTGSDEIY